MLNMVPSVLHVCVSEELFFFSFASCVKTASKEFPVRKSIFFYALRCYVCIGEGWVRVVPGASTKTTKLLKHRTSSKARSLSLIPEWMQWSGTNWTFKRKWSKQTVRTERRRKKKKSRFPSDKRPCPFMPGKFQLSMLRRMGGTRL